MSTDTKSGASSGAGDLKSPYSFGACAQPIGGSVPLTSRSDGQVCGYVGRDAAVRSRYWYVETKPFEVFAVAEPVAAKKAMKENNVEKVPTLEAFALARY
jgi:hypothetical protein